MSNQLTASRAAYKLTHILDHFAAQHGAERHPVDVVSLSLDVASQFGWSDPISQVRAEEIKNFEGALISGEGRREWMLLYNNKIRSPGRIRFTLAHELGHYLLHRQDRASFTCSEKDLVNLEQSEGTIEAQADAFASALLMPLNDFRDQMSGSADLDAIASCANRYGVSLTAAALRWLRYTEDIAVLVVHRDGFMRWAYSSKSALTNGAFFKTRKHSLPIPDGSLAANHDVAHDRTGTEVPARTWFPNAATKTTLREMKISSNEYDLVMTLLILPRGTSVWPPASPDAPIAYR